MYSSYIKLTYIMKIVIPKRDEGIVMANEQAEMKNLT